MAYDRLIPIKLKIQKAQEILLSLKLGSGIYTKSSRNYNFDINKSSVLLLAHLSKALKIYIHFLYFGNFY